MLVRIEQTWEGTSSTVAGLFYICNVEADGGDNDKYVLRNGKVATRCLPEGMHTIKDQGYTISNREDVLACSEAGYYASREEAVLHATVHGHTIQLTPQGAECER